ncbi:hypothetical protein PRK78_003660 [Emydomyces testavorans]|uniref:Uncharacterized protein n=1 Tax=Emydomyces testavorans TaxID=2070801 RepID=A0AAF0DIH9_9EURO|nr:hypothetical protein PRK78_003660 [Emydomyces testavorans]
MQTEWHRNIIEIARLSVMEVGHIHPSAKRKGSEGKGKDRGEGRRREACKAVFASSVKVEEDFSSRKRGEWLADLLPRIVDWDLGVSITESGRSAQLFKAMMKDCWPPQIN